MSAVTALREPIYTALWTLIQAAAATVVTFPTNLRYLKPLDAFNADQLPALLMIQHGEVREHKIKALPVKRKMTCSILLYVLTPDPTQTLPATLINNVMDAFDTALEGPNRNAAQTLGGLVEHVYFEGDVVIMEGQVATGETGSIVVCPVTILIP
jgi:hypothetical protein